MHHTSVTLEKPGKEEKGRRCLWKLHPTSSPTKQQVAFCFYTALSLHNYSSEGLCLNREKVKQLYRKIHNIQFWALSCMHSLQSFSHARSLSGSSPSSDVQSSWIIKLFPQNRALWVYGRGLLLFIRECSCMAQCEPDKSEGSFMDVASCLFIPLRLNHLCLERPDEVRRWHNRLHLRNELFNHSL